MTGTWRSSDSRWTADRYPVVSVRVVPAGPTSARVTAKWPSGRSRAITVSRNAWPDRCAAGVGRSTDQLPSSVKVAVPSPNSSGVSMPMPETDPTARQVLSSAWTCTGGHSSMPVSSPISSWSNQAWTASYQSSRAIVSVAS